MPDEILKELWKVKDTIAREHGYDLRALGLYLRNREAAEGQQVVDLAAMRAQAKKGATPGLDKPPCADIAGR